eukprot:9764466-Lingulodinium_polyedra.AAC.1
MQPRRRVTGKRPPPPAFGEGPVDGPRAQHARVALLEPGPPPPVLEPQRPAVKKRRTCYSFQLSFTRLPGRRQPASFTRAAFGLLVAQRHTE